MDELGKGMLIQAFWMTNANFGDNCNLYLLSALSGGTVVFTGITERTDKIVAIGSILNWCDDKCIAWGPGLANASDCVNPGADLRAVRGPRSRQRAKECGNTASPALGDPVLLLPRLFNPKSDKRYRLGIVPHYVDQLAVHRFAGHLSAETRIVNVFESPENVVRAILSCDRILSSSLHGLIAAHAYGVPAIWVSFGGPIGGDGTKYRDYLESVGVSSQVEAFDLSGASDLASLENLADGFPYSLPVVDRAPELIQSAPFPMLEHISSGEPPP